MRRLLESLRASPVVRLKGYEYFVHPITDGIPAVEPALLQEVVDALRPLVPAGTQKLLTAEAMGISIAAGLSLATGLPFSVARKRKYGLPGEIVVPQRTGYGEAHLHVHGLQAGERVLLVDDVVSTGGTLRALAAACQRAEVKMTGALLVVNKDVDLAALGREIGTRIEALVRLRVRGGAVQLEVSA